MSLKKDVIGADVQINSNEAQKSLVDLSQKTSELANENDRLRISQAKLKALNKENTEEYKKITKTISDNSKQIKDNNAQMDALRKTIGLTEMSQTQLKKRSLELRRELNGMTQSADPERFAKLNSELVATENQFKKNKVAIGEASGFLGKLESNLISIPGPAGSVIQSVIGVGKALWALVANPIGATIAIIVGGLTLLYKAFTSTDSGANMFAGTMKGIGNVLDVLIDRTMSFFKMLGSIATFDWQGFKKNGADAFSGIGKQFRETAAAGYDYVQMMDDIDDRESAAQNRMTKLRVEIEKLKNLSKDQTKTSKERMDAAQKAMDKEIELNNIETGFLTERNVAETKNLASKIQNSKLSMAEKEKQLQQWLMVDDLELQSMMEKDAAFAEFVNKNEKEFQALQKTKAEELNKEAELATETRRLQSSLSGFKKELLDEEINRNKEAAQKSAAALDVAHATEVLKIKQYYSNKEQLDKEYKARLLSSELAYLMAKETLETDQAKKLDLQSQIIDKQKEYTAALKEAIPELMKTYDAVSKSNDKLFEQEKLLKRASKAEKDAAQDTENLKKKQEEMADTITGSIGILSDGIYEMASGTEDAFKIMAKNLLKFALEQLKYQAELAIAGVTIQGLASLNPAAMLVAAGKIALIEATFAGIEGLINGAFGGKGKQSGGFSSTDGPDNQPDGVYHKNEFIASAPAVRNPTIRPILNIIDMAQRQGKIASLNLPAVMASMGAFTSGTKQSGGFADSSNQPIDPSVPQFIRDPELIAAINSMTEATNRLIDEGVQFPIVSFRKKFKKVDDLLNQTGMGGFSA